jgi:cell wall-associated NlpC family hydrolase
VRFSRTTLVALPVALLAGALLAGDLSAASTKEKLQEKQAQARSVLSQVNALDTRFEASVEAWNGAKYELSQTRAELARNEAALKVAEHQRRIAMARVRTRLVALYESNDDPSTIGILLGSSSVSDLIDHVEAARDVAASDHHLAVQTTAARDRYVRVERRTLALEQQRAADVRQLATQRAKIGAMLGERKRLLASVQGEVNVLRAQEVREQAALAAQARARLAAQQAALQRAAAARAAAAAAAAKQAKPAPTPTAPTTTQAATTTSATTTVAAAPTTTTVAPTPPAPVTTAAVGGHPEAATIALRYLGIPYVWGGASPSGFDCSGLVMYVFAQLGISLPHFAAAQFGLGSPVARSDLQPGDLVFFDGLNHVGIYIGGGEMVHAPQTGDVVKIEAISDFGSGYVGARRI